MEIIDIKHKLNADEMEVVSGGAGAYVEPPEEPGDGWKKMEIGCREGVNRSALCRYDTKTLDYLRMSMISGLPDAGCHIFRCSCCNREYAKYMITSFGVWYERMACGG